jgi:hypothetical protein
LRHGGFDTATAAAGSLVTLAWGGTQRLPSPCRGTAEAKPEHKARWRAAGLRGLESKRRQQFACRMWIRAARGLRDGGREGAQGRKRGVMLGFVARGNRSDGAKIVVQ